MKALACPNGDQMPIRPDRRFVLRHERQPMNHPEDLGYTLNPPPDISLHGTALSRP